MGDELMTAAVELTGITKRFGDVTAVDHVDLAIEDGEFFAMLGPSGCGKTTTLRMIAGLEFPTEEVSKSSATRSAAAAQQAAGEHRFQNYALFPHMNVLDNVAFGLRMEGVQVRARARAAEAIGLVQLAGLENRKPSQMSGGQQQRVALAGARQRTQGASPR